MDLIEKYENHIKEQRMDAIQKIQRLARLKDHKLILEPIKEHPPVEKTITFNTIIHKRRKTQSNRITIEVPFKYRSLLDNGMSVKVQIKGVSGNKSSEKCLD